ncbi:hypothetical protein FDECE_5769 [Fusarium decemcellulare]|nr:hypothetical protein FDECE_5769 [Fusarium decemcellulare]
MKFTTVASVLAMAATAMAGSSEFETRTAKTCTAAHHKQVCCNGLTNCLVQVAGQNCVNKAYCCKTDAPVGTFINIQALNCVSIL